jgi:phospholipid/cholesterol/gamma-HCH transport system substrate-binding protein
MSITTDSNSAIRDGRMGVFVLISIIFLMGSYLWFKAISPWNPQQRFDVHFQEVAALNDNAPVLVNGVRVGSVESIHLKGKDAVHVRLQINTAKIVIPEGSTFRILSNNVVGVKYIDISLPMPDPSKPAPKPLDSSMEIKGQDPGRPEVLIDSLTATLEKINFEKLEKKVSTNLDELSNATKNISKVSEKFGPVADKTISMEGKVSGLADEFKITSKRINKIIDNPQFVADLKDTTKRAKDVAISVQRTMDQVDDMLKDKELRAEVKDTLARLNEVTLHVQHGMESFEKLAQDKEVRGDMKAIVVDARHALDKVDKLVSTPSFGADVRDTLKEAKEALEKVNTVSLQVNQMLSKKHPLLHMIFGAPGKLKVHAKKLDKSKEAKGEGSKDSTANTTTATTTSNTGDAVVDEMNKKNPSNE